MTTEKINNTDFIERIRKNILENLELWGSKDKLFEYQKNVPIAQVSAELFCQWDETYHPNDKYFLKAFNEKERIILANFDRIVNEIAKETPNDLPDIVDFVETQGWRTLNELATKTLGDLETEKSHS